MWLHLTGQAKNNRKREGERRDNTHQRATDRNRTTGCCGEETASVRRAHALPSDLPRRPEGMIINMVNGLEFLALS